MITEKEMRGLRPATGRRSRQFLHRETPRGCEVHEPTTTAAMLHSGEWHVWALRSDGSATARVTVSDTDWHLAKSCPKESKR